MWVMIVRVVGLSKVGPCYIHNLLASPQLKKTRNIMKSVVDWPPCHLLKTLA